MKALDDWSNMTVMGRAETRNALIRKGCDIIARQGFNSTGINAVLLATGVPKGSFYYYFSSKEDFGLAVIEDFANAESERLERLLGEAGLAPLTRLRSYFDAGIEDMKDFDYCRGCPIGNLAQELAAQSEVFRTRLHEVFDRWQNVIKACLDEACSRGELAADCDTGQLAAFVLAGWEGATLRAKVTRSVGEMSSFVDLCFARVLVPPGNRALA